jgi:YHS domain-containing protein
MEGARDMDLNFQIKPRSDDALVASYACPCGCTPRVTYAKGTPETIDGCCCGNEFAVGPNAGKHLHASDGFVLRVDRFAAPWGESLEAAWKLGAAQHPAEGDHDHQHDAHGHQHAASDSGAGSAAPGTAIDPVCGMTVDIAAATEKGLHVQHQGTDYYFCGKGCKLEFGDDPAKYLDPSYTPSM